MIIHICIRAIAIYLCRSAPLELSSYSQDSSRGELKLPSGHKPETCEPCLQGKQGHNIFADQVRGTDRARRVLERVHLDLSGPFPQ